MGMNSNLTIEQKQKLDRKNFKQRREFILDLLFSDHPKAGDAWEYHVELSQKEIENNNSADEQISWLKMFGCKEVI